MRVAAEANVLETAGTISARKSTIKTSRKTFRMVIDGIYSDKIGSIVREIAANAFDSHLRAKQGRPFYVHCPNALKPEFFVRDFGVGMTDRVMEEVYIVVGESDKDMTDDEVGMWGLGSKSPFAYGDQYYISCYDGETVRHYGYGIAEDGVPTLFLMNTEPSDEPRGVKVGFSVEAKDFAAFEKAIRTVSYGHNGAFESNATLHGLGEPVIKGAGWAAYKDVKIGDSYGYGQAWFVRQGCILYPIASQQVRTPSDHRTAAPLTYILDCPIGTVKMTTSREEIAYEEEVKAYLTARLEKLVEEVTESVAEAVADIGDVATYFEMLKKIKPAFVQGDFSHPVTKLTSPAIPAAFPTLFFHAKRNTHGQWEFSQRVSIDLNEQRAKRMILVDDITPLFDPSRDPKAEPTGAGWLTNSEVRRISRFTRAYLDKHECADALFITNVNWSDEFWTACFRDLPRETVTFDALRNAVPRRLQPPKADVRHPIRGLALAKAAGEQKPVFEIDPEADTKRLAWVTSDQYRRQAAVLFKIAKRYEIDALYIAAPGEPQEMLEKAAIQDLRSAIDIRLREHGATFADWCFAKDNLDHHSISGFVKFLRKLKRHAPAAYPVLTKGKGAFSDVARMLERLIAIPLFESMSDEEKRALDALMTGADGKAERPEPPEDLVGFSKLRASIADNAYQNPTCRFVSYLGETASEDKLTRLAKSIVALQKIIPPNEKFS